MHGAESEESTTNTNGLQLLGGKRSLPESPYKFRAWRLPVNWNGQTGLPNAR
jgi:hypothetical protein